MTELCQNSFLNNRGIEKFNQDLIRINNEIAKDKLTKETIKEDVKDIEKENNVTGDVESSEKNGTDNVVEQEHKVETKSEDENNVTGDGKLSSD